MADLERAKQALLNAHNAGDVAAAKELANFIKSQEQQAQEPSLAKQPAGSAAESFGMSLADSVPFGQKITSAMAAGAVAPFVDEKFGDLYKQAQDYSKATAVAHPTASTLGSLAGIAVTLPLAPAALNKFAYAPTAASKIQASSIAGKAGKSVLSATERLGRVAATSAPIGALYGAGTADDMTQGAVEGAGIATVAGLAAPVVGKVLSTTGRGVKALFEKRPDIIPVGQAKKKAAELFAQADALGGVTTPERKKIISETLDSLRPQDIAKAAVWDKSGVKQNVDMIKGVLEKGDLTFSGAYALRADLNNDISMAYKAKDYTRAKHLEDIKDIFNKEMTNPDNLSGLDMKSKNARILANHEYSKGSILDDLKLIVLKATTKQQPANSIDTSINNFLNNKNASAGLRADERKLLEDVVKKTQTGELLKSGATRLLSTAGASVGGVPGFLAGHFGSQLNRNAAEALKLRKLDKVYELINNRPPPKLISQSDVVKESVDKVLTMKPADAKDYLKTLKGKAKG